MLDFLGIGCRRCFLFCIIEKSSVRVTEAHSPCTIHFVSGLTLTAQRLLTGSSYRSTTNNPAIDDSFSQSRLTSVAFEANDSFLSLSFMLHRL